MALALGSLLACSSATVPDAGAPDAAGARDAAAGVDAAVVGRDAEVLDAITIDDARVDADARDAVAADTLPADAIAVDAAPSDAEPAAADAAPEDAAAPQDAATPDDAAAAPDATPLPVGCSPSPPYTAPTPAGVGIPTAGLAAWVRADLGLSLDGAGGVCVADDLSGRGHHFAQTAPATRPTVGMLGGQAALAITGLQGLEREDLLGIAATSSRTVVVVLQLDDLSARTTPLMQGDTATNDIYLGPEANTFMTGGRRWGAYMTGNAYDGQLATSTDAVIQVWSIDTMAIGAPILAHLSARINGAPLALTRTPAGSGNGNIEGFGSAHRTWLAYPRAGQDYQLAEVLVWSRSLSVGEIGQVEAYLAGRYGIGL